MDNITLDTKARQELVDITDEVHRVVAAGTVVEGICHLWCYHTSASLTVNECADPAVKRDLLMALDRIVQKEWPFEHAEGNSPAHVKSSLLGCQLSIPIHGGALALGTWQAILFAEFDGPRRGRQVSVTLIPSR